MRWLIPIVVYLLLAWYAFQSVRTLTQHKGWWLAYWLVAVGALVHFVFQAYNAKTGISSPGLRYGFGFLLVAMVPMLVLSAAMFVEDLWRIGLWVVDRFRGGTPMAGRRKFISQLGLLLAALPMSGLLYGMYRGRYQYRVLKYELSFPDLPPAFDGYKVLQISDIHSGSLDNPEKVGYGIDLINEQEADAVLFTGDVVNNLADELADWQQVFGQIRARDGVFSVLGNHDYGDYVPWESEQAKADNLARLKQLQKEMGWRLLLNEKATLRRGDEHLHLVGVENWGKGRFAKHGDLDRAADGLKADDFKILLSHDPSHWDLISRYDERHFQLTLSGHTHGMQFGIEIPGWIKWSPVQYRYRQWAGIYQHEGRYLNVNRGFGYLAYPGRVGVWPEITLITLRRGHAQS